MRSYIRHPSEAPIEFKTGKKTRSSVNSINNISAGGLCFKTTEALQEGQQIEIKIPNIKMTFRAKAVVVWCRRLKDNFLVGVKFNEEGVPQRLRMIEQVCYIDKYYHELLENEGRKVTWNEAAIEWIEKYAGAFPQIDEPGIS